jgi:hypothetical protein
VPASASGPDRWTAFLVRHPLSQLGLLVCLVAGAWINVQRTAYWTPTAIADLRVGAMSPLTGDAASPRVAASYGQIVITAPAWRPLELTLEMRARPGAAEFDVPIAIDGRPAGTARATRDWTRQRVIASHGAVEDEQITLGWDVDPKLASGFELRGVTGQPRMLLSAVILHALPGAAVGGFLFLLWHPRTWRWLTAAPPPALSSPHAARDSRGRLACIGLAIFAWFLAWGAVKPLFQAPDEPQHLMRAEAQLRAPWVMRDAIFEQDRRFLNPLALWHPPGLWKVIPHVTAPLTIADLDSFKQTPWLARDDARPIDPYRTAIASYPPLYYWVLFAPGELLTRLAGLSPYQSFWLYRVISGLGAALLWLGVFVVLRRLPETRTLAPAMLAFLLLNPMVDHLSAAVNADAFSVPLATLALLLAWQTASSGLGAAALVAALLVGLLVKPAGVQVAGCVALATLVVWLTGQVRWRDASRVLLAVAMSSALAYAAFYAWSPPRIFGAPQPATLLAYLGDLPARLGWLWMGAWGVLGWVDLHLAWPWYAALLALLIVGAICAAVRPAFPDVPPGAIASTTAATMPSTRGSGVMLFLAAAGLLLVAMTIAGEFRYLSQASYFLQGRYFLPAIAGVLPALMHRVSPVRVACLALLLVMNLLLMADTVLRCYGDWHTFWRSLPFVA